MNNNSFIQSQKQLKLLDYEEPNSILSHGAPTHPPAQHQNPHLQKSGKSTLLGPRTSSTQNKHKSYFNTLDVPSSQTGGDPLHNNKRAP